MLNLSRFPLALALLAGGCGTGGYHVPYHGGHSANPTAGDAALLALDVALGALDARAAPTETTREDHRWDSPSPPRPSPPPQRTAPPPSSPARRLFGKVTWESGGRVPFVMVTLRGTSGTPAIETRTDISGRFWFPWPQPAGWYRISVSDARVVGETHVWISDERPAYLEVIGRPAKVPPWTSPGEAGS